jgi:DNA-binding ferritin-like protein (Dps family)
MIDDTVSLDRLVAVSRENFIILYDTLEIFENAYFDSETYELFIGEDCIESFK